MKAILISIKPKYVADILNHKKTIEVRKVMPKCEPPIDVYIYCTKGKYEMGKFNSDKKYHEIRDDCCYAGGWLRGLPDETVNGKVVAKFTLNKVSIIHDFVNGLELTEKSDRHTTIMNEEQLLKSCCLTKEGLYKYGGNYAWHIDNLVIFDKPKELSEFIQSKRKNYDEPQVQKAPQSFMFIETEDK